MQTGKLDQRLTIQQETTTTNDFGEVVKVYSDRATVWAHVISRRGKESFDASRNFSSRLIKVKIRYREDVETTWRVAWNDDFYNVIDVDRSLRRDGELWLMCEMAVNEGIAPTAVGADFNASDFNAGDFGT